MWAVSLLTIVLLFPLLSAAPLDIAGGDTDGMHSHDENVTRGGKFFGHNQFDVGNINVPGSVAGDDVSIGHQVDIDVQGYTRDHHHQEDETGSLPPVPAPAYPGVPAPAYLGVPDFKKCLGTKSEGSSSVLCFPFEKPAACNPTSWEKLMTLQKEPKERFASCGIFVDGGWSAWSSWSDCTGICGETKTRTRACSSTAGDKSCTGATTETVGCDLPSCKEAPKQEGESCGSCFCPPTYSAGDCAEGLTCERDDTIPDAPGICTRPGGHEEPEEKKVVIPCGFNDEFLAPRLLPNGQKSPYDNSFQWKNNIVPYYFSNDDYRDERQKVEDRNFVRGVMDKFEERTCFKFVEKRKNQLRMEQVFDKLEVNEHVLEINIQDNFCYLGNQGVVFPVADTARIQLYLLTHVTGKHPYGGSKCRNEGLVIHELMHAFGVGHTHRRKDRDRFIQVISENLKDKKAIDQYEICKECVTHTDYECGSIMHYGSHDNSEDLDKAVIVPLNEEKCKLPTKALQVYDASPMDWQLLNIIGECPKLNGQASPDVQSSPVNYPEKLANVDRVLRGYDIMNGNPLPLKEILVDPGLRKPIFEATYHEDSKTPDHRYLQPDGVDILNCADSCSTTFKTDQFSGAKSYQQTLSNEVAFSLGGSYGEWGAKFSASKGFREVSDKTSSESKLFTMSSATCCAYKAELRYDLPSLDKDFLLALEDLTEKYDENIYLRFILHYGTHFIGRVTMGSKFVHLKEISKETVSTLHQNGVDIKYAAEVSAYAVTASVDTSSTNDNSVVDSFSSELDNQNTYAIGVKSPEDGKAKTWIQKPLTNPAPIQIELTEIVHLLDLHKDIKVSAAVKVNLRRAMNDYCGVFQKAGRVSTCSAPGPDPPIPTNQICTENNYNYHGNNIENRKTTGQEECANWCGAHKECNAWTLRKSDNWCWIKTSDAGRRKDNLRISGTKGCARAIDGGWSGWSESSECSASCGAATRKWARTCTNPAPANGGKSCEGNDEETRSCDQPSCVICPHKDVLSDVLLENNWRTQNQIFAMSEEEKRNTVIGEVEKMTGHTIEDLQGRANSGNLGSLTAIANMAALLIKYSIYSSSDVKTMTYEPHLRNTLIVEISKRFQVGALQHKTDRQLLYGFCKGFLPRICSASDAQYYSDPNDNTKFYQCAEGHAPTHKACLTKTIWSQSQLKCENN